MVQAISRFSYEPEWMPQKLDKIVEGVKNKQLFSMILGWISYFQDKSCKHF